jgi:LysR family glycine cleavage system transcriptional activator
MARDSLPPLPAVRCFEAAARHRSFTRAADDLGLTQSAVSHQIRLLEERLGTPLFQRGPRGVTLTETGAALAPRITAAFDEIRGAFDEVSEEIAGTLSIDAVPTFGSNWLAGRLGAFQMRHPDLAVRLNVSNVLVDFARDGVDVAIRSGSGPWPGLVVHPLLAVAFTPFVGRALAERHAIARPEDLLALPIIDPHDPWWPIWFKAAGVEPPADLAERRSLRMETQVLAGRVALAGQGVAMLTPAFFRDEIAAGLLVQPFPLVATENRHYCLVYPESRRRSARIRAFRDWLTAAVAEPADG